MALAGARTLAEMPTGSASKNRIKKRLPLSNLNRYSNVDDKMFILIIIRYLGGICNIIYESAHSAQRTAHNGGIIYLGTRYEVGKKYEI